MVSGDSMRLLRALLIILFAVFFPAYAFAQTQHNNFAWGASGSQPVLIPYATITVCNGSTLPSSGQACTTNSSKATIYTDATLGSQMSNPITADVGGNFAFWGVSGQSYVISVAASGYSTASYQWTAGGTGGNVSTNGTITANYLAMWYDGTHIKAVQTLPALNFPAMAGDLSGTAGSLSVNVIGLRGSALPGSGTGYLGWNGTSWSFSTTPGGGNVSNTGTPAANQLAIWTSSTVIQGITTLPATNMPALLGDLTGSTGSYSVNVTGLLSHALPTLSTGYLNWTGTAWAFSAGGSMTWPGGQGIPIYSGSSSWSGYIATTGQTGYLYNNNGSLSWGAGGSMTWPAAQGLTIYSGSSSWSTSVQTTGTTGLLYDNNGSVSFSQYLPTAAMPGLGGDLNSSNGTVSVTIAKINGLTIAGNTGYLYNTNGTLSWATGGSMTWPAAAGIPIYSGSSTWATSIGYASGKIVGDTGSGWGAVTVGSGLSLNSGTLTASGSMTWPSAQGLAIYSGSSSWSSSFGTTGQTGYLYDNNGTLSWAAGGSMTWPSAAGIPIYSGSSSWSSSLAFAATTGLLYDNNGTLSFVTSISGLTLTSPTIATGMTLSYATGGGAQCLHVNNTGVVTTTGSDCGSASGSMVYPGGSGLVQVTSGNSWGTTITYAASKLIGDTGSGYGAVTVGTGLTLSSGTLSIPTSYLASPPGIGGTSPGAGAFTTLSATGTVTFSGLNTGTAADAVCLDGSNHLIIASGTNCYGASGGAPATAGIAISTAGAWGTSVTIASITGVVVDNNGTVTVSSTLPSTTQVTTQAVGDNSGKAASTAYADNSQMMFPMNTQPIGSGSSSNLPGTAIFGPLVTGIAYTIPTNGANGSACASQLVFGTNPATSWVGTLYKIPGGTGTPASIGTITVATNGGQTWSVTQTSFAASDGFALVPPGTVDNSAANPMLTVCVVK